MTVLSKYGTLYVSMERNDTDGVWEFCVYPAGVKVVFAARKLGGIDSDLIRADAAAAAAQATAAPPQQSYLIRAGETAAAAQATAAPSPQNEPPAPPTPSV